MNLQQIIELLRSYDHALFFKINNTWASPLFDLYFPNITDLHRNPIALVIFGLAIIVWIFRQKERALKGLLVLIIAIAASDLISYRLIKPYFHRDRPAAAGLPVELRSEHHSGSSFPSNHASNIFAAATVITLLYPPYFLISFLIAFSVAYSRVYVGVHFPSDVIAGAILGYLIGKIVWSSLGHWVDQVDYSDFGNKSRFYITRSRDGESDANPRKIKRKVRK